MGSMALLGHQQRGAVGVVLWGSWGQQLINSLGSVVMVSCHGRASGVAE